MPTISSSAGSTTPDLILSDSASLERESRTIVHELLSGGTAYTLRPPGARTGTLRLFYATEAAARAGETLHASPVVFTLDEPDSAVLDNLAYVVMGTKLALDPETLRRWIVEVRFSEVS